MNTTAEPPGGPPVDPPAKTNRRTRWIGVGAAGAAVVLGVGVAVASSKDEVKLSGLAPRGRADALSKNKMKLAGRTPSGGRRALDHRVSVRRHPRLQAYGPGYSLRREIWIDPHSRGPAITA